MVTWLSSAAESLFATLFPADCRFCGAPLLKISRLPVCEECLAAVHSISGETCVICGERIFVPYRSLAGLVAAGPVLVEANPIRTAASDLHEPRCGVCRRLAPPFARALSYGSYDGGLRELIHLLKYEQVRPAADVLGRMLAEVIADLEPFFGERTVLVLPVPLHPQKLRQRGFNQSELLARSALKLRPAKGRMALETEILTRRRATQSQIGLTRHQRRENLRGAFLVKPANISGREVLLVDDVFTTGTTVSECARLLRRAGASRVWVATVARTLRAEPGRIEIHDGVEIGLASAAGS